MRKHYKTSHLGLSAFKCPTCGKTFKRNEGLKKHIDNVHIGKRFFCPDCDVTFSNRSNLTKHVQSVHKKERLHPCTHPGCDYSAAQPGTLRRHVAGVHGTEKSCICTFRGCDYATTTKNSLYQHMKKAKVHEDDREVAKIMEEACDKILNPFLCKVRSSC